MAPPANKHQKRRIQPQLIAADGADAGVVRLGGAPGNVARLCELGAGPSDGARPSAAWQPPSLREDAEFAAAAGMKGRRIHVELDVPSKDVNWRKLLKAQGVSAAQVRKQKPVADAQAPPQPGAPPLLQAGRQGVATNPLASVIARLERQYVIPSDGESSSSEEAGEGEREDADSEGQSGDESGTEREGGGVCEGDYDYEDEFIDDSEFADFVGGDRRRPKHAGFFINKGEIEKGEEVVAFPDSPPKRQRRSKRPRAAASADAEGEGAGSGPDARRAKAKRSKKAPEDSEAGGRGGSGASGPAAQSAPARPASLAAQAAAAGAQAADGRPAANGTSSDAAGGFSDAMARALQEAAAAAAACEPEPAAGGGGGPAISKALNPALQPLACLLALEGRQQAGLRDRVLDEAARLCGARYARGKLAKRLDSLAKSAGEEQEHARQKVSDHVATRLAVADQRQGDSEGPAAPEAFPWDKHLEHHVLTFASVTNKLEGRWGSSADLHEPLARLLPLWPPGRMSLACLQAALQRAVASPRAQKALAPHSFDSGEQPLPSAAAPPPQASPRAQAPAAQQPPQPPPSPAAPAAAAAAEPAQPAADTRRPEAIDPALEALQLGADAVVLSESIKAANTNGRAIINKTLMCAGAHGYTTQEVLDKANALRLTGGEPWDRSKKATISNTIRAFKFTAHIGGNRYAHTAFPGVSEAAARETGAQDARRRAREEAATRAAAARPPEQPAAAAEQQAPIVLD